MPAELCFTSRRRRRHARRTINSLKHDLLRSRTAHHSLAAELIPDLAVMLIAGAEQTRPARADILHSNLRDDASQFAQDISLVIHQSRIFRRQVDGNMQWTLDH